MFRLDSIDYLDNGDINEQFRIADNKERTANADASYFDPKHADGVPNENQGNTGKPSVRSGRADENPEAGVSKLLKMF